MGGRIALPGLSLYHTSKWAIEGFFETLARGIAPFGIEANRVEPGGARVRFGHGRMIVAPALAVYRTAPFSARRKVLAEGTHSPVGDPAKMVRAMIASVGSCAAPPCLVLGSETYRLRHDALTPRLVRQFHFLILDPMARERDLQGGRVARIRDLLAKPGNGFAVIANQHRLEIASRRFSSTCCSIIASRDRYRSQDGRIQASARRQDELLPGGARRPRPRPCQQGTRRCLRPREPRGTINVPVYAQLSVDASFAMY